MKIVFLADDFPPESYGGGGISAFELALVVKKSGHEVFVITTSRDKGEAGESEYHGLKIFKIVSNYPGRWRWYYSLYNPQTVTEVKRILALIEPDIVHINNIHFYLSYYCFKLAKRYAKGVVFTARDVMTFNFSKLQTKKYLKTFDAHTTWLDHIKQARKRWNPFRNVIIKHYLKYADKIFAVSHALKIALEQNGITNAGVIHTGVDLLEYPQSFSWQHKKNILFAGRLSDAKGMKSVEQAIEIVKKEMPDASLLTAGANGEWLNRDEMKEAYASSDIVLVPSICFDSLPRMVLEASASGRPVISSPYGGAKEVIIDNVTGYIIDPRKPDHLAEKILDLLKNPEKGEIFGKAGYERIRTSFNLEDKVKEYITAYKALI